MKKISKIWKRYRENSDLNIGGGNLGYTLGGGGCEASPLWALRGNAQRRKRDWERERERCGGDDSFERNGTLLLADAWPMRSE